MRWSFNHAADAIWRELDPVLWSLTHNPWFVLQTVSRERLPTDWVTRIRKSMARLTPKFSSGRSVREYTEAHYLPAAARYCDRAADGGRHGAELLALRQALERGWDTAAFGNLDIRSDGNEHSFAVEVDLGSLDPGRVQVELYADGQNGSAAFRQAMTRGARLSGAGNRFRYAATTAAARPPSDFTPRLVPGLAGAVPVLEVPLILWFERPRGSAHA
jgi:starch phosphorylase